MAAAAVALTMMLALAFAPVSASFARPTPGVPDEMAAAVTCVPPRDTKPTVLMIPGTGATPGEVWSWTYQKSLSRLGFGVCTVALPDRALGDFGRSVEYAAYAARVAYRETGRKIAMLGHSQGGLIVGWLMKFFPDIAAHTDDAISLAGPMNGTRLADMLCAGGTCASIAWQLRTDSNLHAAFAKAALPEGPSVTSIASLYDTVVFPQPESSRLTGASSFLVQDVCPGHLVEHGTMISDGAVYAIVLDALTHRGPAAPRRVPRSACRSQVMPGLDPSGLPGSGNTLLQLGVGLADPSGWVAAEPAVPRYAW